MLLQSWITIGISICALIISVIAIVLEVKKNRERLTIRVINTYDLVTNPKKRSPTGGQVKEKAPIFLIEIINKRKLTSKFFETRVACAGEQFLVPCNVKPVSSKPEIFEDGHFFVITEKDRRHVTVLASDVKAKVGEKKFRFIIETRGGRTFKSPIYRLPRD